MQLAPCVFKTCLSILGSIYMNLSMSMKFQNIVCMAFVEWLVEIWKPLSKQQWGHISLIELQCSTHQFYFGLTNIYGIHYAMTITSTNMNPQLIIRQIWFCSSFIYIIQHIMFYHALHGKHTLSKAITLFHVHVQIFVVVVVVIVAYVIFLLST